MAIAQLTTGDHIYGINPTNRNDTLPNKLTIVSALTTAHTC